MTDAARLLVFAGLPGVGKTTLAREIARIAGAVYLRVDTIEHALARSALRIDPVEDAGYQAAFAVAEDNLRLGLSVVADTVNPIELSRRAWRDVGVRAGSPTIEIEVICSDAAEHRRRVESRIADIDGFRPPTWRDVEAREYHPWTGERIVIDTAGRDAAESVAELRAALLL